MVETSCQLGVLSRPDGSAQFCEGETVVMAGIYGPVESKLAKSMMDKANVEAHFRPKAGLPGVKDRLNEAIIKNVCETVIAVALYPRAAVVVVIQEMQNNGQLISCALNAVCLACLDAAIDMRFMFAAVTCFLDQEQTLGLAPPQHEEDVKASFMFVFDSVDRNIIASHTEGCFTEEQFKEALSLCRGQSTSTVDFFKRTVQKIK